MLIYLALYYILCVAFVTFILNRESKSQGKKLASNDLEKYLVPIFILAPILAPISLTILCFGILWNMLTYFSAENRHKRALEEARRKNELWKIENKISLDLDSFLEKEEEKLSKKIHRECQHEIS